MFCAFCFISFQGFALFPKLRFFLEFFSMLCLIYVSSFLMFFCLSRVFYWYLLFFVVFCRVLCKHLV